MQYAPWDTETSNNFRRFDDERDVLGLVRRLVMRYGDHCADDRGWGRVADDGTILPSLSGEVRRAPCRHRTTKRITPPPPHLLDPLKET
jgi:hypothetical protein